MIKIMHKSCLLLSRIAFHPWRCFSSAQNITISNIYSRKNVGDKIKISGWVKSVRKMKDHIFIDLNDGSCNKHLQVTIARREKPKVLSPGTSLVATGLLGLSPSGQLELSAEDIGICGECVYADGYPFAPKVTYTPEYIRQHLHFRLRTNKFSSLLRIRDYTSLAIHNYLHEERYIFVQTPILTSNDCEGAGEVFTVMPENELTLKNMIKQVDSSKPSKETVYFDSKVFLTVSGQLHLEAAAHGLSKVYTLGPTFRAENSKSRLHLSEFYMLEVECAFLDRLEQLLDIIEKLVKTVATKVLDKCEGDVVACRENEKLDHSWIDKKFVVLTYDEAVAILNNNVGRYKGNFIEKLGLTKEHERFLVDYSNAVPTFVINFPKALKPFYAKGCVDDDSKVAAVDLLTTNVGELVGGSLRENDYNTLKKRLEMETKGLDWYLEMKKYGGVPTGGFGLGFERYLQFLLGISNIKDTIPFPRWPHNCSL